MRAVMYTHAPGGQKFKEPFPSKKKKKKKTV